HAVPLDGEAAENVPRVVQRQGGRRLVRGRRGAQAKDRLFKGRPVRPHLVRAVGGNGQRLGGGQGGHARKIGQDVALLVRVGAPAGGGGGCRRPRLKLLADSAVEDGAVGLGDGRVLALAQVNRVVLEEETHVPGGGVGLVPTLHGELLDLQLSGVTRQVPGGD